MPEGGAGRKWQNTEYFAFCSGGGGFIIRYRIPPTGLKNRSYSSYLILRSDISAYYIYIYDMHLHVLIYNIY